jgi:hypothetical protein
MRQGTIVNPQSSAQIHFFNGTAQTATRLDSIWQYPYCGASQRTLYSIVGP